MLWISYCHKLLTVGSSLQVWHVCVPLLQWVQRIYALHSPPYWILAGCTTRHLGFWSDSFRLRSRMEVASSPYWFSGFFPNQIHILQLKFVGMYYYPVNLGKESSCSAPLFTTNEKRRARLQLCRLWNSDIVCLTTTAFALWLLVSKTFKKNHRLRPTFKKKVVHARRNGKDFFSTDVQYWYVPLQQGVIIRVTRKAMPYPRTSVLHCHV